MKDKEFYDAIRMLYEQYDYAKEKTWILDPLGYALYQVWQKYRDKSED